MSKKSRSRSQAESPSSDGLPDGKRITSANDSEACHILYFDPFNGVSGDMVLGALIDLGLPLAHLRSELSKLGLEDLEVDFNRVERHGLRAANFQVTERSTPGEHSHEAAPATPAVNRQQGGHHQEHSHLKGILHRIRSSRLDPWVKEKAALIFRNLGEAEAKVHGTPIDQVHFHEVGAIDSIVDIVGACIGLRYFGVSRFFSAPMALGGGTVTFSHGTWPVPAPATVELLHGYPCFAGPVQAELTTPTGAAIVTALVERGSTLPICRVKGSGFGAGDREFAEIPNVLRLILAEPVASTVSQARFGLGSEEEIIILEASIDNMEPESLGYFFELALNRGALDVYYSALQMKKNRPGVLLTVLCHPEDRNSLAELIFRETATLGVRWKAWKRWVLPREVIRLETEFGAVRVKVARDTLNRVVNVWPEYEDLRELCTKQNVPLKEIRLEVFKRIKDWKDGQ